MIIVLIGDFHLLKSRFNIYLHLLDYLKTLSECYSLLAMPHLAEKIYYYFINSENNLKFCSYSIYENKYSDEKIDIVSQF